MSARLEAWLRGPVEGVPDELQPVAHALIDAGEEIVEAVDGLTTVQLRARPGGVASLGFHLRHVAGSLERLFTYARGEALSEAQLAAVAREGESGDLAVEPDELVAGVERSVAAALDALRATPPDSLGEPRAVGRRRLPSTVRGLLFHAAEHTRRHAGQVIVTARMVRATPDGQPAG